MPTKKLLTIDNHVGRQLSDELTEKNTFHCLDPLSSRCWPL